MQQSIIKKSEAIFLSVIVMISIGLPMVYATTYESYEGVTSGNGPTRGVNSDLTVESTKVSPSGFANHRDYMVYANDASCGTCSTDSSVGAGWYIDTTGSPQDLIYDESAGGYPGHDIFTSIPAGNTFDYDVVLSSFSPTQQCWHAYTYSTDEIKCITSVNDGAASNVGVTGRTFTAYSSSNTMPGLFDYTQDLYYDTNTGLVHWEYFSQASGNYKCWSNTAAGVSGGYVLDWLASRSGGGSHIDEVGTGPDVYTSDSCSSGYVSSVYQVTGESTGAGKP